jgi:hypothetical protein
VNVEVVSFCELEANVYMLSSPLVRVLVPREAANDIATLSDSLIQQICCSRVPEDPFLGEGDNLDVTKILVFFARQEETLCRLEPTDGADIGEEPK